jgi:hypothetical protein
MAIVQTDRQPGEMTLTVSSAGLAPATLTLRSS